MVVLVFRILPIALAMRGSGDINNDDGPA